MRIDRVATVFHSRGGPELDCKSNVDVTVLGLVGGAPGQGLHYLLVSNTASSRVRSARASNVFMF